MARQIYPLNALRAFEASARHLSYVTAAEELHVTPAAISHQVKKLEDYLGVRLFRRQPRGLLMTEAGQAMLPDLRDLFLRLDKLVAHAMDSNSRGTLTISVAPAFAVKWLVPRLGAFGASHPEIDLRMSSSLELIDFQRDDFDAAIRLGSGNYRGLASDVLFDEFVTPMCSPELLDGGNPIRSPDDLRDHVLLHDDSMSFDTMAPTWRTWLAAAGATRVDAGRGPHFGQPDHALQAAIDGAGIVLGWRNLAADDIAAGRLAAPFDLRLPLGAAFYFVRPETISPRPKVELFRSWLFDTLRSDGSTAA